MLVGDYLSQDGTVEMAWFGSGAKRLNLSGHCRLEDFQRLCAGRDPESGERLTQRNRGAGRRVCYFAQISPPKDVSILHLVGGDERIADWWKDAVAEVLAELETMTATRVRRDERDADRRTGSLVAAIVTHDTNRAMDPQLHTHVCVLNHTFDAEEGRWKSVQPWPFFQHQGFLREVCYNRLARAMTAAGYEIESGQRIGFTVRGVPTELREIFSKRRREILRQAARAGATSQDDLQSITARSRAEKRKSTASELRAGWLVEAGSHLGALQEVVSKARSRSCAVPVGDAREALISAEAHLFERSSVVEDRVLLREALIAARGSVSLRSLRTAVIAREKEEALIRSGDELASRTALEAEAEFICWAHSQRSRGQCLGAKPNAENLTREQLTVARGVLGETAGVIILKGDAGTGKTTCLKAIVDGIRQAGGSVFGCAPTSNATDILRADLSPVADTLQQLLSNPRLQDVTTGSVLVVDEAGLVSVTQMRDLCRLAARNGNRLLLVGDTKQHTSIEAGDALRCLEKFAQIPVFRLTAIHRQRDRDFRRAVALLARGNAFAAFNHFDRLGAVKECPAPHTLWNEAAADYVRTVTAGKTCLAISPVWSEIREFSAAVRVQLRCAGAIAGSEHAFTTIESLNWTREEKRRAQSYRPGDVLFFHRNCGAFRKFEAWNVARIERDEITVSNPDGTERRIRPRILGGFDVGTTAVISVASGDRLLIRANAKPAKLRNGELVEVARVADDGDIYLRDGRIIPTWFRQFVHGYCTTSHASQGKTVDRGILIMGEAGIAAGNLKQAYVSNSRFRESQVIYTTDKTAARAAMVRPADRELATELFGAVYKRSWRANWISHLKVGLGLKAA